MLNFLGINGGMSLKEGKDASGRKAKVFLVPSVFIYSIIKYQGVLVVLFLLYL